MHVIKSKPKRVHRLSPSLARRVAVMCLAVCMVLHPVQAVEIEIRNQSPVDVILTSGETSKNLEEIQAGLSAALTAAGVDPSRVNVQLADGAGTGGGTKLTAEDMAGWSRRGLNSWSISDDEVFMRGYSCKRSALVWSNWEHRNEEMNFTIECDVMCDSSDRDNNNYFGFILNDHGSDFYAVVWEDDYSHTHGCGHMGDPDSDGRWGFRKGVMCLVKVTNCDSWGSVDEEDPDYEPCKQDMMMMGVITDAKDACQHGDVYCSSRNPFQHDRWYHMKVEWEAPKYIRVYVDDELKLSFYDWQTPLEPGPWGLFGLAHGSSSEGVHFKNIKIGDGSQTMTDLLAAVRSPSFRPDSYKFVVDACDVSRTDFEEPPKTGELVQRLAANDLYYVGIGTNDSRDSIQKFIARNDGKGKYVADTGNYYRTIAEYIASVVNKPASGDLIYLLKKSIWDFRVK